MDTQAHSWGSRYTSIGTQLALQDALTAFGQGLLAVGGEDGDVSELAHKLNSEPLQLITKLHPNRSVYLGPDSFLRNDPCLSRTHAPLRSFRV